jgi:hypothetical protein
VGDIFILANIRFLLFISVPLNLVIIIIAILYTVRFWRSAPNPEKRKETYFSGVGVSQKTNENKNIRTSKMLVAIPRPIDLTLLWPMRLFYEFSEEQHETWFSVSFHSNPTSLSFKKELSEGRDQGRNSYTL